MIPVTEKLLTKAGLTREEKKVIRFYLDLPSAGKRTHKWVKRLTAEHYVSLLNNAQRKIREAGK